MACEVMRDAEGRAIGIACTRGGPRCGEEGCGSKAPYLCDWKLKGKKAGRTCDRRLCEAHATSPEGRPDVDLCPAHWRLWARHPANPKNAEAAIE